MKLALIPNERQVIGFILLQFGQRELVCDQISKLCTHQRIFLNINESLCCNHSIQPKGSIPRTSPKVFKEFGKIWKISRRASMMKCILYKVVRM